MSATVFVSSPCYDLVDVRAELEAHIRELGLLPVLSDRASSEFVVDGRDDSIETCLVNLRKADVVLVVLSQRYGPALPAPYDGLSATHVEYREAMNIGKPVHFYARDRLLGDYDHWRANSAGAAPRFRWVREEKDHALFRFIKEHDDLRAATTAGSERSNWIWPFRDSVDLKIRVAKDLDRVSRPARMRQLIGAGAIPFVVVTPLALVGSSSGAGRNVEMIVENGGPVTACGVKWHFAQGGQQWNDLGTISPAGASAKFSVTLRKRDSVPVGIALRGELRIQFSTATGHVVNDLHTIDVSSDGLLKVWITTRQLVDGIHYPHIV